MKNPAYSSDCVLVRISRGEGSIPREVGAWMLIGHTTLEGSIGGGRLEWEALQKAREMLLLAPEPLNLKNTSNAANDSSSTMLTERYPLGPSLGQCCGGVVWLSYQRLSLAQYQDFLQTETEQSQNRVAQLALFGGGHVGKAIIHLLSTLPYAYQVRWIDSRQEIFPTDLPAHINTEHSDLQSRADAQSAVDALAPESHVLIMSFSHTEDLHLTAACLRRLRERGDMHSIGLIGSRSKWAGFQSRLREQGFSDAELAQVRCPIGLSQIQGKQPATIAIAAVAQLLSQQTAC